MDSFRKDSRIRGEILTVIKGHCFGVVIWLQPKYGKDQLQFSLIVEDDEHWFIPENGCAGSLGWMEEITELWQWVTAEVKALRYKYGEGWKAPDCKAAGYFTIEREA